MNKWKKRAMGCLLSVAMLATSTGTALAAQCRGSINGVDCYGTLSCSITQATSVVKCLSADNDYISVSLEARYSRESGGYGYDRRNASSDKGEVELSVTATQSIYQYNRANSEYYVKIGTGNWGDELTVYP